MWQTDRNEYWFGNYHDPFSWSLWKTNQNKQKKPQKTYNSFLILFWHKCDCHANWPGSVWGAQGAVSCHRDALRVAVVDQLLLGQVWMALHLQQKDKHTGLVMHCRNLKSKANWTNTEGKRLCCSVHYKVKYYFATVQPMDFVFKLQFSVFSYGDILYLLEKYRMKQGGHANFVLQCCDASWSSWH